MMNLKSNCIIGATALLSCGNIALAADSDQQSSSSPTSSPQAEIQEIIVTATKTGDTALEKTPATVNVVSGAELTDLNIKDSQSLAAAVPGLTADLGSSNPRLVIRGISTDSFTLNAENPVAVYYNGVYEQRTYLVSLPFFDLDRAEVLKGPQGVSYGRDATAGAVVYTTAAPQPGESASISVGYGNFEERNAYAVLNEGGDRVGARLAMYYDADDGDIRNLTLGTMDHSHDNFGARASIRFNLSDNSKLAVIVENNKYRTVPVENAIGPTLGMLIGGVAAADSDTFYNQHQWVTRSDLNQQFTVQATKVSANAEIDFSNVTLKSITGYVNSYMFQYSDQDASSYSYLDAANTGRNYQWSQEFLANGDYGRLHWLAGVWSFYENANEILDIDFGPKTPSGIEIYYLNDQKTVSYAGYANAKFDITDWLHAEGGVRYSNDRKSIDESHLIFPLAGGAPTVTCGTQVANDPTYAAVVGSVVPQTFGADFHAPTWSVGLNADLSQHSFAYAKVSTGYKSGGFNNQECPNDFQPEHVTSYEIGLKNTFFDGNLRANISAYHYDFTNMQVETVVAEPNGTEPSVTSNAAKSRLDGADVDFQAKLGGGFLADGGVNWLPTAEYTQFLSIDTMPGQFASIGAAYPADYIPRGTTLPNGQIDLAGNRLNRAPVLQGTAGLQYSTPLVGSMSGWSLRAHLGAQFLGAQYYDYFNRSSELEPGRVLGNAFVVLENTEQYTVRAYVTNMFDKFYANNRLEVEGVTFEPGDPRKFGIEVSRRF